MIPPKLPSGIPDYLRFAARCSVSAVLAYIVAADLGLDHPIWAPISALVVSRDKLAETHELAAGRFIGTVFGAIVAVVAYEVGRRLAWPPIAQLGAAVAVTALAAKARPSIRACMWTCAVVLLTGAPGIWIPMTAVYRSSEVMVGMAVSLAIHVIDERGIAWIRQRRVRGKGASSARECLSGNPTAQPPKEKTHDQRGG